MLIIKLSGGPAYRQVAEAIRQEIIRGHLAPGKQLPTVRQAAMDWGVSHGTVQRAYEQLANEGYVAVRIGQQGGTFVGDNAPRTSGDDYETAREVGKIYGGTRKAVIISAEVVEADEKIAQMLGLKPGDKVVRRERVTYPNVPDAVKPLSVSISYHDATLVERAPKLVQMERVPQGTPRYIEEKTGYVGKDVVDMISARAATEHEAEMLGVEKGEPVQVMRTTLTAQDGYVVEYGICVTPANTERTYHYVVRGKE